MIIDFGEKLEEQVTNIATRVVGSNTDPDNYIVYFDDHLHDVDVTQMPFLVVTARSAEASIPPSIGASQSPRVWTVHLYYLDINASYPVGKAKRGNILERLTSELDRNWSLDNLNITDTQGNNEYVWNSDVTNILFDYSGQDGYYTFVSEIYLQVFTDRSST